MGGAGGDGGSQKATTYNTEAAAVGGDTDKAADKFPNMPGPGKICGLF